MSPSEKCDRPEPQRSDHTEGQRCPIEFQVLARKTRGSQMWRYPELTEKRKRKILGLNSARLYGLKPGSIVPGGNDGVLTQNEQFGPFYHPVPSNFQDLMTDQFKTLLEFPGFASDNLSRMRTRYAEMGGERSNTRFGWIRNRA